MKIEFDIVNREFFRTLMFSLKFQKKAQVSIIYMKNIVFSSTFLYSGNSKCFVARILYAISFQWSKCFGYRDSRSGYHVHQISGVKWQSGKKIKRNSIVN